MNSLPLSSSSSTQAMLPPDNSDDKPEFDERDIPLEFVMSIYNNNHEAFSNALKKYFDRDGKRLVTIHSLAQDLHHQLTYRTVRDIFFNCIHVLDSYGRSPDVADFFIEHGKEYSVSYQDIFYWNIYFVYPGINYHLFSEGYILSEKELHARDDKLKDFYGFIIQSHLNHNLKNNLRNNVENDLSSLFSDVTSEVNFTTDVHENDFHFLYLLENKEDRQIVLELYRQYKQWPNLIMTELNNKIDSVLYFFHEQKKAQLYFKLEEDMENMNNKIDNGIDNSNSDIISCHHDKIHQGKI